MLKISNHYKISKNFLRFERIRFKLKASSFTLPDIGCGAGSRYTESNLKRVKDIILRESTPLLQTLFLCRLINKYKIKVFLELGTSVGINILRLALLCPEVKFVTIEANPYYIRLAKLLSKITGVSNVEFINNYFSEVLPGVLARYKPEFVYVDGDHSYSSTVQYFNMICSYCGECTRIVVIDDITWSESMRKAWKNLFCRFVDKKISFYKFGLIILKTHL